MTRLALFTRFAPILGSFFLTTLAAGSFVKVPESVPEGPLRWAWVQSQEHRAGLTLAAAAAVLVSQLLGELLEKQQLSRKYILAIVETLHKDYFGRVAASEKYKHRVTLFRRKRRFYWPFGGEQLVIQARSRMGTYGTSRTWFRVHDAEARNEGVVGRAWFTNACVTEELPSWPDEADDADGRLAYAARGYLSVEKAERLHVKSEAISATIVRVKGKKWGVLVVDSMERGVIDPRKERVMNGYAELLGEVL